MSEKAGEYEQRLGQKRSAWSVLDGYYIPTRYPNGLPDGIPARVYNKKVALEAVGPAAEVVDTVARLVGI